MSLDQLIERAEALKSVPYDSPKVDMWKDDTKAAVVPYGEASLKILEKCLWFGRVITSPEQGQRMHIEALSKAQEFLSDLKERDAEDASAQSAILSQKRSEAKATIEAKFAGTKIIVNGGTATFGDHSPVNNLQVGELLIAILQEAEKKLPDSSEKRKILASLQTVLANPTFAAIAGTSLPEIIRRLTES